jgi:hypothetical protein
MDEISIPSTACVNCGVAVTSKFCAECGQPNPPKKLGLRTMWYDFQSRIIGFDGMFPRTIKDLTLRPGKASKNYVYGNRMMYYGPVGYFFLMITLWLLLASFLNIDMKDLLSQSSSLANQPQKGTGQEQLNSLMFGLITENWKLFSFMIIPVLALVAKLFFRRSPYNLVEHAVLPLYVTGHTYWISALSLFVIKYSEDASIMLYGSLIIIPYYIFASVAFYDHQSKLKVIFKSFFVYIFSYLIYTIIFVIIIVVYVFTNPKIIEAIKKGQVQ